MSTHINIFNVRFRSEISITFIVLHDDIYNKIQYTHIYVICISGEKEREKTTMEKNVEHREQT